MAARTTGAGTVLLTAALASVALGLAASPASAASTSVDFTGGSVGSLLVCKSQPSSGSISVVAGSTVTFGNHLGQTADLKVNGRTVGSVPANQARPVVFNASASVSMTFACSVGLVEKFGSVSVSVTPAPQPAPAKPAPTTGGAARTGAVAPTTAGGAAGSTANRTGATAGRTQAPGATAHATPTATPPGAAVPGGPAGAGPGGVGPGGVGPNGVGPNGVGPNGVGPNGVGANGVGPAVGDPALGGSVAGAPGAGGVPGAGAGVGTGTADSAGAAEVAVGPLEPASGTPTSGPRGLLALIAAVCIIGVTFAAFRAILAQRSNGARFA